MGALPTTVYPTQAEATRDAVAIPPPCAALALRCTAQSASRHAGGDDADCGSGGEARAKLRRKTTLARLSTLLPERGEKVVVIPHEERLADRLRIRRADKVADTNADTDMDTDTDTDAHAAQRGGRRLRRLTGLGSSHGESLLGDDIGGLGLELCGGGISGVATRVEG